MDTKRNSSLTKQPTDPRPSKIPRMSTWPLLGKVCLICNCAPEEDRRHFSYDVGRMNYWLFLLDLDVVSTMEGDDYIRRNPNLWFNSNDLGVTGVCVVGSTLYLFGAEKNVFSYDLSSIPPATTLPSTSPLPAEVIKLTPSDLSAVSPMKRPKYFPQGCATPDGMMIVFSSVVEASRDHKRNGGDFELFNPRDKSWTLLPDLRRPLYDCWREFRFRNPSERTILESYSFIDNSPVLLITTEIGNLTLNLEDPSSGWSRCDKYRFAFTDNQVPYILVRDRLCLSDWFAWDDNIADPPGFLSYPEELNPPEMRPKTDYWHLRRGSAVTWLTSSNQYICAVRGYVTHRTRRPHLVVDVYEFDDSEEEINISLVESSLVPGAKLVKRFKFVLRRQRKFQKYGFFPNSLFSIPPAE